jgi:hypothetical protein
MCEHLRVTSVQWLETQFNIEKETDFYKIKRADVLKKPVSKTSPKIP